MKEALKLALKAMKSFQEGTGGFYEGEFDEEIKTCEEALAQPVQQEPVAWQVEMFIAGEWVPLGNPQRSKTKAEALASNPSLPKEHQRLFPVYTSPSPQRKPLTYVDLRRIANQCGLGANEVSARTQATIDNFARAIEAAHNIKENT